MGTTFIATGDTFITRRIPQGGYDGCAALSELIKRHDLRFTNLEMTFHRREGVPAAVSGGTWAMADPVLLDDLCRMGFNIFNTANNHSCDYSHGGLLATIKHLNERDMIFSGTGKDLGDASKACYFEAPNSRVALIGACATFAPSAAAGAQSAHIVGRPGINPLRFVRHYHLDRAHFEMVQELIRVSKINAEEEYIIKTGYKNPPQAGTLPLGKGPLFVLDDRNWIESFPDERDMKRITAEISEAKKQADTVMVSIHAHEYDGDDINVPAQFIEKFARGCIDAGASVVIGHGPHLIRGIELYKGGVIFYSLGNFIFETETVEFQPWDACFNKGLPPDTGVGAYMDNRSKNGTVGYGTLPEIWEAFMASWEIDDGALKNIEIYPLSLGMGSPRSHKGVPVLSHDEKLLRRLARLSEPYGTELVIENGRASVRI
ncbi:MAG: CapA family protein [Pyramidobacter sp.]|jgi:poly-gamma-glutamate capsule biosynthesis protein CapA/YwtB (metallophosphatase superfamily)